MRFLAGWRHRATARRFHRLYYYSSVWQDTRWLGVPVLKCPLDLWVYQELLTELRPDLVIETGTAHGGSALFIASCMDLLNVGRVVTVDIEPRERPKHPRITYLTGSSTDQAIVTRIQEITAGRVMVILDSDHSRDHVLAELRNYSPMVTAGSYLIVEDTCVNGRPVLPDHGPGPHEATEEFLAEHPGFAVDSSREKFLLTFNPDGYLRAS